MTQTDPLAIARDEARKAYEAAQDARKEAERAEAAALDNWSRARIEYARANPPALAGQLVARTERQRINRGSDFRPRYEYRDRTTRGTVTLYEGLRQDNRYRNHWPIPGEWFVMSPNGITAYALEDRDGNLLWSVED